MVFLFVFVEETKLTHLNWHKKNRTWDF